MRREPRSFAFPYIIIAVVLVAALPFNSFALSFDFSENQLFQIMGASNWQYAQVNGSTQNSFFLKLYQYDSSSYPSISNDFYLMGRSFVVGPNTSRIRIAVPFFLDNLTSFGFDLYYGLYGVSQDDSTIFSYNSYLSYYFSGIYSNSGEVGMNYSPISGDFYFDVNSSINSSPKLSLVRQNFSYSSSDLFDVNFAFVHFNVDSSFFRSDFEYYIFFGIGPNASLDADSSSNINQGIYNVQLSIDSLRSSIESSNQDIIDELGNVIYYLEDNLVASSDSIAILEESISKSEDLTDLGDALASVPKPSINNITNTIRPSYSMSVSNPQSVQSALSVIYSWDKFIAIIVLFGALGTISYILFGKKK